MEIYNIVVSQCITDSTNQNGRELTTDVLSPDIKFSGSVNAFKNMLKASLLEKLTSFETQSSI